MNKSITITKEQAFRVLEQVQDPEIPNLSIVDLGIVRDVKIEEQIIHVTITPTYCGCPALEVIETSIIERLVSEFQTKPILVKRIDPPWTSDWITERGRESLRRSGIAPPAGQSRPSPITTFFDTMEDVVRCPRCESAETKKLSQFGSTACKAFYTCTNCLNTFDYFKIL